MLIHEKTQSKESHENSRDSLKSSTAKKHSKILKQDGSENSLSKNS